jgi:hypothetical protein
LARVTKPFELTVFYLIKVGGVESLDAEGEQPVAVVALTVLPEAEQLAIVHDRAPAAPRGVSDRVHAVRLPRPCVREATAQYASRTSAH